jgi:hypothetical protein
MHLRQPLSEGATVRGFAYAREYGALQEYYDGGLNATWPSDEAHFHLGEYVNKRNIQYFAHTDPKAHRSPPIIIQRELHYGVQFRASE